MGKGSIQVCNKVTARVIYSLKKDLVLSHTVKVMLKEADPCEFVRKEGVIVLVVIVLFVFLLW